MRKCLHLISLLLVLSVPVMGQTVVLDFEDPATSTDFQYFGGSLEGVINTTLANPNPSGINTSATVSEFIQIGDAPDWGGAFSNPDPSVPLNLVGAGEICIKVHRPITGNVRLKFEQAGGGAPAWEQQLETTAVNEWEELCFDLTLPSLDGSGNVAAGNVYGRLVLFFDFGVAGDGTDYTNYFDDVVIQPAASTDCNIVLDFEEPNTTTNFQYFGGSLEGVLNQNLANPNPSGINTSATVSEFIQIGDAPDWGGAFSNPDPSIPLNLAGATEMCIKVHRPITGNVRLKFEQAGGGAPAWEQQLETTAVNEWEELCFDLTLPSLDGSGNVAAGNVYGRLVLFFDFGVAGDGTDYTNYFDDICIKSSGVQTELVTFSLDMNEYADPFTLPHVSGDFNSWSGDANPMEDPDGDGVWTAEIEIPLGQYEYKFTLDNWAVQEEFNGLEECTNDPGGYVNRLLAVNGTTDLGTVCWNSCYACGESVQITFEVGMGNVMPSPDGVWVVGGGNFDAPGGPYQMDDSDGDGIYVLTVERPVGFSSYYAFANGNCPDFSCKENLSGLPCADPDNFDDRFFPPVTQDTVIATCYEQCTDFSDCEVLTELVTFSLDMNEYADAFTLPHVSGDFNSWSGDANPMEDPDGDGVWTAEIEIALGTYEYKFTLDNWAVQEEFNGLEECTTAPGGYINRILNVEEGSTELGTVCWNSCYACGESVQITFELGMGDVVPSPDGVWLVGGGNFDVPGGTYRMDDSDGDGIYTITVDRAVGFSSYYAFANGNCPDFSCKEDLSGQDCADPDNFNDRFLPAVTQDTTIATCYELCAFNTDCEIIIDTDEVLDASQVTVAPNPTTGDLFVTFTDVLTERAQIRVINTLGAELLIQQLDSGNAQTELNLSDLSPGVYYLHVQVGERFLTRKIVKQ